MVLVAVMSVNELGPAIRIDVEPQQDVSILVADGVLDSSCHRVKMRAKSDSLTHWKVRAWGLGLWSWVRLCWWSG